MMIINNGIQSLWHTENCNNWSIFLGIDNIIGKFILSKHNEQIIVTFTYSTWYCNQKCEAKQSMKQCYNHWGIQRTFILRKNDKIKN